MYEKSICNNLKNTVTNFRDEKYSDVSSHSTDFGSDSSYDDSQNPVINAWDNIKNANKNIQNNSSDFIENIYEDPDNIYEECNNKAFENIKLLDVNKDIVSKNIKQEINELLSKNLVSKKKLASK